MASHTDYENVAVPHAFAYLSFSIAWHTDGIIRAVKGGSVTAGLIGGKSYSTLISVLVFYKLCKMEMLLELPIFYCTE